MKRLVWGMVIGGILLVGCTFRGAGEAGANANLNANAAAIQEESRALTAATVDALGHAPTNAATALALRFAKQDQRLEGLPLVPIDVPALLASNTVAWRLLGEREKSQEALVRENAALKADLDRRQQELIAMGKLYEAERNKNIVKRIWQWSVSTLGIGGLIALCIFFPAIIPVIGNIVGWVIGKVPQLAGYFGVVSKKVFDGTVRGVEKWRHKKAGTAEKQELDSALDAELDAPHKAFIKARKAALSI